MAFVRHAAPSSVPLKLGGWDSKFTTGLLLLGTRQRILHSAEEIARDGSLAKIRKSKVVKTPPQRVQDRAWM